MKITVFHLSIFLLAFVFGFTADNIFTCLLNEKANPKLNLETFDWHPVKPFPAPRSNIYISNNEKVRFIPTVRSCGLGYDQSYQTNDEQPLEEGMFGVETSKEASATFNKMIAKASRVIEQGQRYRSHPDKVGERVIVVNPADENGEETISILWSDGKHYIAYINAPTLELALEFEQFLEANKYLAP